MADRVQWLSLSDYVICISILVEFQYKEMIATRIRKDAHGEDRISYAYQI